MQYPSVTEYKDLVQIPECFSTLQDLSPVRENGKIVMTSGNFAVVFKMQDKQGHAYALKCFTQDVPQRNEAYKKIARQLRYLDAPYFASMEYLEKEIVADDDSPALPVVLMDWVEGNTMDNWIKNHRHQPEMLHLLAYKFSVMASWLINQPFAHGDLKPDNILVNERCGLTLVDYDGLYVPGMQGEGQRECGTPGFRHPLRPQSAFDERIDDFSFVSILLSIYAFALKPELIDTRMGKDRLLFAEEDYVNIPASKVYGELMTLCGDSQFLRLMGLFQIALADNGLSRCENRLLLLTPPDVSIPIPKPHRGKSFALSPLPKIDFSELRGVAEAAAPRGSEPQKQFTVKGVSFTMIKVEAGTFTMGATPEMKKPYNDEKITHQVILTNDYYIGKTQVTQALWEAVMGSNPSVFYGDNLPVVFVSWDDCQKFISKLNSLTGQNFRLPTEAEWEYAARGGNKSKHYQYSGGAKLNDVAWYGNNSGGKTHPVATKNPNELGIHDMSGNVWEWCSDWYDRYNVSPQTNPIGPDYGRDRVTRGGGWSDDARRCRSSYRNCHTPVFSDCDLGLRLVLVP